MAKELRIRRGTTAQHSTFTGAPNEVTADTTKKTLVYHDGTTVGGNPLARENLSNVPAGSVTTAMLADGAITSAKIADGAVITADLADAAVTTAKLADANVTGVKLAAGAVAANLGFTPASSTATVNLTGDQTVGGVKTFTSGVRFNDGTTQTTAAGALTTTGVLNATAGATVGTVGSYSLLTAPDQANAPAIGATMAGSSLRYASCGGNSGTAPAGTWRQMGFSSGAAGYTTPSSARTTLWLRIS